MPARIRWAAVCSWETLSVRHAPARASRFVARQACLNEIAGTSPAITRRSGDFRQSALPPSVDRYGSLATVAAREHLPGALGLAAGDHDVDLLGLEHADEL